MNIQINLIFMIIIINAQLYKSLLINNNAYKLIFY